MKILYLVDVDLDQISGVASKVLMQAKEWTKENHEVYLLSIVSLSFFNLDGKRISMSKIQRKTKGKLSFIINAYKSSILLKFLISDLEFDIVYMRYKIYDPFFKYAVKNKPVIAEMNTVYETETRIRSLASYIYYRIFKSLSFRTIEGFICVSNEINLLTLNSSYKSIVLANGINTSLFSIKKKLKNTTPKLLFMGSPNQAWHGIDKILILASKLINCEFHIVGPNKQELQSYGEIPDNIIIHGYCDSTYLDKLIPQCDIGISTLALHRKNMHEASPLKSREYLAYGLPIIYAYNDTDIENNVPFALKIKNSENNIQDDFERIQKFIYEVFNNENIRKMSRQFAESTLDLQKKEFLRLQFMKEIILKNKTI
jgi:hypothetical protein